MGTGDEAELGVLGAIADADRRLRGRGAGGFMRFGDEARGAGVDVVGESGWSADGRSARGVARPLLCADGGFGVLGDELESFCDSD
jgi:hypothetical protein